jgi:hypothetical protein
MWFLIGAGLIGAGLFLTLRSLIPWMSAQRTGVIRSQGSRAQKIERAQEPDRFRALSKQRLSGVFPGLLCVAGGIAWLAYNFWALSTYPTE